MTNIWELHDIGRTICSPIEGLYECVEQFAHKFYSAQRADELIQSARLREERGTTPQQDFNDFCNIWVKTIEGGDFKLVPKKSQAELVIPGTVVYKDAVDYLIKAKKRIILGAGQEQYVKIGVLTSGTEAFNVHMLNAPLPEPIVVDGRIEERTDGRIEETRKEKTNGRTIDNLADLVDKQFRGEEYGDKDKPESLNKVYFAIGMNDTVYIIFDDKVSVCEAVMKADDQSVRVVLMDRKGDYKNILDIDRPFTCYEDSLKFRNAWEKLSDKEKRVVRLHGNNQFGSQFPHFEVVASYTEFLERQVEHMKSYKEYQNL